MLSSRVSLAVGTVSLVAVTSIGTAVLVNDGTGRLAVPSVPAPRTGQPDFQAPPLVVPRAPGTVTRPVVRVPATPPRVVAPPFQAAEEREAVAEPPAAEPPVTEPPAAEPPVTEPPAAEPPVTEPPLGEPTVDQDKGRHLGWYKHPVRGKGHHGKGRHGRGPQAVGTGEHQKH